MSQLSQDIFTIIRAAYANMTHVERVIADFFLAAPRQDDLSLKEITTQLFVSEASLSRFARRCGFKGYREFIYQYRKDIAAQTDMQSFTAMTQRVITSYQSIFTHTVGLIDESQIRRTAELMNRSERVFVCGNGSSGIAAREFKLRFMRLGLFVDALDDYLLMQMNAALVKPGMFVIGMSISGKTREIIKSLKLARERGADVLLITANRDESLRREIGEVLPIASDTLLDTGISISPQFPLLVAVDVLFSYYLHTDFSQKAALHRETLEAMHPGGDKQKPPGNAGHTGGKGVDPMEK